MLHETDGSHDEQIETTPNGLWVTKRVNGVPIVCFITSGQLEEYMKEIIVLHAEFERKKAEAL